MNSSQGPRRQRHGIKKKLVEGAGGLVVGAALVVFLRGLSKNRRRQGTQTTDSTSPPTSSATQANNE
ncbi:hypothetical protein Thiowin_03837 [Thiorhodovibrio winogradskyi]|uniref:Uncharacterized protein n=1 Tax=Thiorhodovibrio winogradskyi TaxID=77007 RepID=A0ABZ0SF49_9GAMM|nr:carbon monoxide dehydrogenase [Thiorhodovibrio winogradskyi]